MMDGFRSSRNRTMAKRSSGSLCRKDAGESGGLRRRPRRGAGPCRASSPLHGKDGHRLASDAKGAVTSATRKSQAQVASLDHETEVEASERAEAATTAVRVDDAGWGAGAERSSALRVRHVEDSASSWIEVSSEAEPTRLRVKKDGTFELWGKCGRNRESLCCSGAVTLPREAETMDFRHVLSKDQTPSDCDAVTIKWSDKVALIVSSPRAHPAPWSSDLSSGFVLDAYRTASEDTEMVEVRLDVDSAGRWFGGAHFMNQLWPLNKVSWETGPFYPFDHGPTGLNTLVAPQWMTSSGLLVMVDPDTPFLHAGMNAPQYANPANQPRRQWGTGVQNATNPILPTEPRECRNATGFDGVLRLQSRKSFEDDRVRHTWSDWTPHSGLGSLEDGLGDQDYLETHENGHNLKISVALCAFPNVLESALASLRTLPKPATIPDLSIVRDPIWTTWAKYKQWVSEDKVLRYAKEILNSGLDYSVMEIDDRWQIKYGDLDFDPAKFPDPKGMVDTLHDMGFQVTLWVMPFFEKRSAAYREGVDRGYFVKKVSSPSHPYEEKPGFFKWWNLPSVVALDVTNPEAVDWYVARLRRLQTLYGIDGFKFDAGEPCFLPKDPITKTPLRYPSEYTHLWVREVAGKFQGGVCEVRTGHKTQDVGMMTRLGDRFSTWDVKNGLQSIIPTVVTSGLLGYPFALPDIIGGNAYFGRNPDTELFVRWTQVNALMPAMQFSIAPWHVGQEAQALVSQALRLRKKLIREIVGLAEDTRSLLAPIVRPMWWLDPEDEKTYEISDQYAVGNDIIVAPVVVKGQRRRDVYLTSGTWEDLDAPGQPIQGGQWLLDLDAPLDKLPCFRRVTQE